MRFATTYLAVPVLLGACATFSPEDSYFSVKSGSPCAFVGQHRFAIYGALANEHDSAPVLLSEITAILPNAIEDRESNLEKVTVQYFTHRSDCLDCRTPYGPRMASGDLQVGDVYALRGHVIWGPLDGGSERKYAHRLAKLIVELHDGRHPSQSGCKSAPPN